MMNLVRDIADCYPVGEALKAFHTDRAEALDLAIAIQQIPSPTFAEAERAAFVESRFRESGLLDVHQDTMHNVFGKLPGSGQEDPIVVSAHTDTVFPLDTDLNVHYENGAKSDNKLIYGPGLADNAMGVAGIMWLARTLKRFKLVTRSDIWFVANVAEEGLGDLRGMRNVVDRFGFGATYLVVEGGSFGYVFHKAIGVRRFRLEVTTKGGHSWGDFGRPNAIHIISRIIDDIGKIPLPNNPKTTYNVGVIEGGISVNSIASSAHCLLDLRSISPSVLDKLVGDVKALVYKSNNQSEIHVSLTKIGHRQAGEIPRQKPPVTWAAEALRFVGCNQISFMAGSTDANVPISRGIPSVCIGLARSGNTHRQDEYLDPAFLPQGMGQLLLLTLAAGDFNHSD